MHRRPLFPTLCGLALACVVIAIPRSGLTELRPLVREMLENLGAVDSIGEGIAIGNFAQVESAANDLVARSQALKSRDLATLGIAARRKAQWDKYLGVQEETAGAIIAAARGRNADAVMRAVEKMFDEACVSCHTSFREPAERLPGSVLFMTNFLAAWKDVNRGLAVRDFALIGRRARELHAVTRTLSWDQVIQSAFGIESAEDRKLFRTLLHQVLVNASRIETAAQSEDARRVAAASRQLWTDGCIPCHQRFRD